MPLRPFPLPFRVGNDICRIARIRDIIAPRDSKGPAYEEGSPLDRFLPKLLTWPERQYFYNRFQRHTNVPGDEVPLNPIKVSQFLAGRWAAKEAIRKACEHLGSSNGFHSIIILPVTTSSKSPPGETSRPQALILRDRLPELSRSALNKVITRKMNFDINSVDGQLCEVSISHDTDYATAFAIVPVVKAWQSQDTIHDGQGHEG